MEAAENVARRDEMLAQRAARAKEVRVIIGNKDYVELDLVPFCWWWPIASKMKAVGRPLRCAEEDAHACGRR